MVEVDFLNEIVSFVNNEIIEDRELETIKYIVSGKYAEDKYREKQELKIKAEEEDRKKKEETINNIKNKTKEMTANTINKISSIASNISNKRIVADNQFVCMCGEKFAEEDAFCANCGKKLKQQIVIIIQIQVRVKLLFHGKKIIKKMYLICKYVNLDNNKSVIEYINDDNEMIKYNI